MVEEKQGIMDRLRENVILRMFLFGIVLVFLLWGVYTLGAYRSCHSGGGVLVGGVWPRACVDVNVIEVVKVGDAYYLPGENYTPGIMPSLNASSGSLID